MIPFESGDLADAARNSFYRRIASAPAQLAGHMRMAGHMRAAPAIDAEPYRVPVFPGPSFGYRNPAMMPNTIGAGSFLPQPFRNLPSDEFQQQLLALLAPRMY